MRTIIFILSIAVLAFGQISSTSQKVKLADSAGNYLGTTDFAGKKCLNVKINDTVKIKDSSIIKSVRRVDTVNHIRDSVKAWTRANGGYFDTLYHIRDSIKAWTTVRFWDSTNARARGLWFDAEGLRVCAQPYGWALAEGDISGHKQVLKLSYNPDIDNVEEDIWEVGGTYVWPTTKQHMHVTSTSASDSNVASATGIKQIIIFYLDSTWAQKYDTVALDGRVDANTQNSDIWRINFVEAMTVGSGGYAAGTITVHSAAGATPIYSQISQGYTKSRQSMYTVPAGKTWYIVDVNCGSISSGTNGVRFILRATYSHQQSRITNFFLPHGEVCAQNGTVPIGLDMPETFPAKTDIKISGIGTSASGNCMTPCAMRGWEE